ncbi:MAG: DUF1385 domain-containing protein [Clostridiales Family XIII bacterium]|jgi:uncharacterized protein YqhQ|nr:DUF1385 domain-containing protein [Clostridiales Family XIII bacterium]
MDFKKIFIEDANPTKIGGQAVMEGIMMKGADRTALCVRTPSDQLYISTAKLKHRGRWYDVPIVRGVLIFVDSLVTGVRSLMKSAEMLEAVGAWDEKDVSDETHDNEVKTNAESDDVETEAASADDTKPDRHSESPGGETAGQDLASTDAATDSGESAGLIQEDRFTRWLERTFGEGAAMSFVLIVAVVIAVVFTVGVFIVLPTWVMNLFGNVTENAVALNFIEGGLRIALFILYIAAISRMKDIQTVFRFHGAEHECIHCYESGLELTPENCQKFETLHPRCGTSFLMFVMVIALLLFSLLGWPDLVPRIISRIVLVPVIAGLSYELLRWAGSSSSPVVKILSVPGLLLQKLTTLRPDEKQLEVAIAAMKAVLVDESEPTFEGYCDKDGRPMPEAAEEQGDEPEDSGEPAAARAGD